MAITDIVIADSDVMKTGMFVWDTNALSWIRSTGGTSAGSNVTVTNFPASPATSTLQTTGNTSLSSIDTKLSSVATTSKQDTGNTSLASIDTKLSSVATTSKQDTGNTSLSSIDTKLSSVATTSKQDTGNTSLSSIDGKLTRTGTVTDRSGTATSSTAQMMAANSSRKYLFIQNVSSGTIYFNFTSSATAGSGSIALLPMSAFVQEGAYVSTEAINVIRSGGSDLIFTAKEG